MRVRVVAVLTVMAVLAGPGVAAAGGHHKRQHSQTVTYGPWSGETATLYGPTDKPRPTIVFVHGGGWQRGTINPVETAFAQQLAATLNWPVLTVNYPTSSEGDTPKRQVEVAAVNDAVHYAAGLDSTDPAHIIVWGESAGGQLALLDAYRDAGRTHPRVSAVVSISGPADMPDAYTTIPDLVTSYEEQSLPDALVAGSGRYEDTSPDRNVTPDVPPTYQAVGATDSLIPVASDQTLDGELAADGVGRQLDVVDTSDHATPLEYDQTTAGVPVWVAAARFLFTHSAARS